MPAFFRNWTQGLWLEPPLFKPLDNQQLLHSSLYASYQTCHFVCLFVCLFVFFQLWQAWVLCIFVLYWHTIPKYFCEWNMLYLPMHVRFISVCIANASALFHEYEDTLVVWHLIKKHTQLPGLLYEVKTSLNASTGCNWKGSFACRRSSAWSRPATLFCFRKFSLVLPITLPPTELCCSTLDALGSHLRIADRSICDQDQDVVKRLIKQCGYIISWLDPLKSFRPSTIFAVQ